MKIRFLGTGAGEGIPVIGCNCSHCIYAKKHPEVRRDRTAFIIEEKKTKLLVETPPDIREIILRYDITDLDAVFISHTDYDHIAGIYEFKYWKEPVDIYLGSEWIEKIYECCNLKRAPKVKLKGLKKNKFINIENLRIDNFIVPHRSYSYAFSFSNGEKEIVYLGDCGWPIPENVIKRINSADIIIINTPFYDREDSAHTNILQVLKITEKLKGKLLLTHISHHSPTPDKLKKIIGNRAILTNDGLEIEI